MSNLREVKEGQKEGRRGCQGHPLSRDTLALASTCQAAPKPWEDDQVVQDQHAERLKNSTQPTALVGAMFLVPLRQLSLIN